MASYWNDPQWNSPFSLQIINYPNIINMGDLKIIYGVNLPQWNRARQISYPNLRFWHGCLANTPVTLCQCRKLLLCPQHILCHQHGRNFSFIKNNQEFPRVFHSSRQWIFFKQQESTNGIWWMVWLGGGIQEVHAIEISMVLWWTMCRVFINVNIFLW